MGSALGSRVEPEEPCVDVVTRADFPAAGWPLPLKQMAKVLIIDDESDIVDLVGSNLQRAGMEVESAGDGLTGLKKAVKRKPDLIVLDLMLPEMSGFAVFKELKRDSRTRDIPVLMLTAKGQLGDKIAGLELGADDYLTKPFSPREMVLRVEALIRRSKRAAAGSEITLGPFHLDLQNRKVFLKGAAVDLTSTEFNLLAALIGQAGLSQRRDDLLREVWGYSDEVYTRTLDTHIKRLREKLGKYGSAVVTVRGVGYLFQLGGSEIEAEGEG